MPELMEQMYCSQQIVIPPNYPYILKKYAKAAIKTQPYDLLRWSFEYFKALAENKEPPVKLRLEYPVFSTEGGLTRGYLRVLANQLSGLQDIPIPILKSTWQGSCLDEEELKRILCLCEVYLREESVPRLYFLAVAAGLLTKSLTHTMILLCETLTKEPDGGSAAVPVEVFLLMYQFLAKMDTSAEVKYINGYKEGHIPDSKREVCEEESVEVQEPEASIKSDEFWLDAKDLETLTLINDKINHTNRLSLKLNQPVIGVIKRSSSVERLGDIEREAFKRNKKERTNSLDPEVESKLREMSSAKLTQSEQQVNEEIKEHVEREETTDDGQIKIVIIDENDEEVPLEIYGETNDQEDVVLEESSQVLDKEKNIETEAERAERFVNNMFRDRQERINDVEATIDELAIIVDKCNTTKFDLGVIAGRQMSATSGEFVAQYIEKDIMDEINEQIHVLPDPDLKKKKAKTEEIDMIRNVLEEFIDENMDVIVPEAEVIEEEELPIPEIIQVYAVPGIGPSVDEDIMKEFVDYSRDVCKTQADMFMPRNIRHFMCPPLEKYIDSKYSDEKDNKIEEVAKEAIIND